MARQLGSWSSCESSCIHGIILLQFDLHTRESSKDRKMQFSVVQPRSLWHVFFRFFGGSGGQNQQSAESKKKMIQCHVYIFDIIQYDTMNIRTYSNM